MFTRKSKAPVITFTNWLGWHDSSMPHLASSKLPNWYKKTAPVVDENVDEFLQVGTIKRCIPILDSLTAGYILDTPCDIYVKQEDGKPVYKSIMKDILQGHPQSQFSSHPKFNFADAPKLVSGWTIQTPPGYSTLFIPPMNNSNPFFEILPAIVDTDKYWLPNFPFILKDVKFEGLIPAQTPFVQIIPFKRERWTIRKGNEQDRFLAHDLNSEINTLHANRYKKKYWTRKSWS